MPRTHSIQGPNRPAATVRLLVATLCLSTLADFVPQSRAAAVVPFTVLADHVWKPPANPALAPHGSVIYPIWSAQNIWKPWRQWVAQPPKFDPYLKEAALILATGARPFPAGGQDDIPDLYREGPDGAMLPFDPAHPLFHTLKLLHASGIKPLIDMGPVPLALCASRAKPRIGAFEFGVDGPADSAAYAKYFEFVKAFFIFLQDHDKFTRSDLEAWTYQLLREPDNPDGWDPLGTGKFLAPGNLVAYEKLYDWTLAGMRAAGLRVNLGLGNLAVPYPGNMGRAGSWMEPLARWVVSDSASSCPKLALPRIDPGRVMKMGFTAYGGCQLSADPDDLRGTMGKVLAAVKPYFRNGNLIICVGEGNLTLSPGNNRGDGTERGAAWNAAIFKNGIDLGLHRFQQWGFSSGGHLSEFEDGRGIMSPAFNVVRMFRMLEGCERVEATAPDLKEKAGTRINGIAARDSAGTIKILLYHYQPDFRTSLDRTISVEVHGLRPGQRYSVVHYRVDRSHGNYFRRWLTDLGGRRMAGDSLDALVGFQLTADQRMLWETNRGGYARLANLAKAPDSGFAARATRIGTWSRRVEMPPNSVSLLILEPAG